VRQLAAALEFRVLSLIFRTIRNSKLEAGSFESGSKLPHSEGFVSSAPTYMPKQQGVCMGQDSGGSTAHGYKTIVYLICMVAALGGLLFGLDQGFIANSLETLTQHYKFGVEGGESYSAILATGGIFGALLSGIFARFLGRKKSLVLAGFVFTAASAFSALLPPLPILSVCRFALGFGVGIASFIVRRFLRGGNLIRCAFCPGDERHYS
jgi:hypothetical protein